MKNRPVFLLCCFLSLFTQALNAQESLTDVPLPDEGQTVFDTPDAPSPIEEPVTEGEEFSEENQIAEEESLSPEQKRIEMEIKTSTLPELAAWCRRLGLSESGTRADLSRRIRDYYKLPESRISYENRQRELTIESAQTAEYFRIEIIDEDYARLAGDVRLILKDNEDTHNIRANEVLFNRTRNIITARGQVVYEKKSGDTIETFRGENITVNIDDWSSIFLDGDSERKLESEGTSYLFSGRVISRTNEDVTILNNARISSAGDDSLWSISASKLMLLPGSDFMIFNAVLRVGEIPVLYIPFFFFPVDEVIFHPVIGYRSREGGFVQTTTYILGRPKANTEETSSLSRIMGNSNDMEKERHGLFLRSTGKKIKDQNTLSLKALLDYYVNMGAYAGLDLSMPRTGILNPLNFSVGLGFTRTVSQTSIGYTPYAPDYDGTFDWNHSNFLSFSAPFRYRISLNSSISGKYGSLSWNFPYYSDPYVDRDFTNRSESMDWMNMIQQGSAIEDSFSDTGLGLYNWHLNGSLAPSFPILAPYISRISVTNLSTTLAFRNARNENIYQNNVYSPMRDMYVPDKYTIYSFSGSVSGTPLTIGSANTNPRDAQIFQIDDPFKGIGIPISPWPDTEDAQDSASSGERLAPPVLNQRFDIPGTGNIKFSIDYQISPTSSTELQFMSENWHSYDQVDWSEIQSILSDFRGNGSINFHMDHSSGLFSNVLTLSATGTWRDYTYLNEEAGIFEDTNNPGQVDKSKLEAWRRQQYSQTNYSTSYTYNGTLWPFLQDPIFGQSNLQYTFRGTLVRSKRYVDGNGPELAPQWGAWAKEKPSDDVLGINSHQLSANIAANIMDKQQNITLSADLPPLDGLISTNAAFRLWISETNANFRVEKPEEIGEWIFRPFTFTETLRFGNIGSFSYYMIMDPDNNNEITTIRSSLKLWDFNTMFSAVKTAKSVFVPDIPSDPSMGGNWEQQGEQALFPKELSFTYQHSFSNIEIIRNRMHLNLNLNTSLAFDLQQHTNSNFSLSLGFTLKIAGFLDLSFSATSENAAIFRYFKGVPGMENLTSMYIDGEQNNLFVDLFDSFNFFDEEKRRRTGFKMTRFDLSAVHYLGDWTAELKIGMFPFLDPTQAVQKYEIKTDVTFLVQWTPFKEIKSDITYEGRYDRWTVR